MTFTNTMSGAGPGFPGIAVAAVNGIVSSSCLDATTESTNTGNSTSLSVISGGVSQASEFIFGMGIGTGGTIAAGQTSIITWNGNQNNLEWTTGPVPGHSGVDVDSSNWRVGQNLLQ